MAGSLKDQACVVGIGETKYSRGTQFSDIELGLQASMTAIEDAGLKPRDIDAVIIPGASVLRLETTPPASGSRTCVLPHHYRKWAGR